MSRRNAAAVMRASRATVGWGRERLAKGEYGRGAGEGKDAGAGVLPAEREWPEGQVV
jgi:hypothetical protein